MSNSRSQDQTHALKKQPRYSVMTINTDAPISREQLIGILDHQNGVTLCVRSQSGHENRGGYFFCISYNKDQEIILETMEQVYVDTFSVPDFIRFINHACGLQFDQEMRLYCQNSINFRNDE